MYPTSLKVSFQMILETSLLSHISIYHSIVLKEKYRDLLEIFVVSNFSYYRPRKSLGGNQLSGSLPNTLGECKSLINLNLGMNRLSGPIPISLGGISSLRYVNIRENFFKGTLSEKHTANLTSLEELDASSNLLTVQVSSNWTTPFQLSSLDLGSCLLGPQFPAWLQTHKYLDYLCWENYNNSLSSRFMRGV